MWVLKFVPDWIFYLILFSGVAGLVVSYCIRFIPVPFIYIYKTPIQLGSILAVALGTFMSGAIYNDHAWLDRVHEMEAKVAEAEKKSSEENIVILEKVVTNTKIIRERGQDVIKYIDREIVKFDNTCAIPEEFVSIHNKIAEQPK